MSRTGPPGLMKQLSMVPPLIDITNAQSLDSCSWYGHRVQPLTIPGGAPPPAIGWGIGWSGPSALKSSSKDCKLQLALPQQGRGRGPALLVLVASSMLRGVMHGLLRNSMSLVESACEWKVSSRGTVWLGACGRHDLNPKWAIHDLRVLQGRGNRTTNPDEAGSSRWRPTAPRVVPR